MNKLVNIIPKFLSEINNFSRREVESFAYLSIEKILGYSKSDCIIHSNQELSDDNIISLENIIDDIKHTYTALLPDYFRKLLKTKRLRFSSLK